MIYTCEFASSKDNGHWHKSYEAAQECNESWKKWRNPVYSIRALRHGYSNKPHGTEMRDGFKAGTLG